MATLPVTYALEPQFKEQFAKFLFAGYNAFTAAIRIWPKDPGLAAMVANTWPTDPYVEEYVLKLKADTEAAKKPATKDSQIKRIEQRMPNMKDDDYIKAERLVAEMSGHIEKAAPPSVNVDNRSVTVERVLVMPAHGDDRDWERQLKAQQAKLIEANT